LRGTKFQSLIPPKLHSALTSLRMTPLTFLDE